MTSRAACALVVLLAASSAEDAAAQDRRVVDGAAAPDDRAVRAEAQRSFDEGVRLLRDRDWAGALRAFEASQALRPTPSVLFNIAGCQRALRRHADARRTYQRFLVIGTRPDQRQQATAAVDELAASVASMTVTASVPGAELLLDGRPLPPQPVDLDVGSDHVLEARHDGHRSAQQTVRPTAAGPLAVSLTLEPLAPPPSSPDLQVHVDTAAHDDDDVPRVPDERVAPAPAGEESGGSALPWILAGTAVVLAGAAVGGYFLFAGESVPDEDLNLDPR